MSPQFAAFAATALLFGILAVVEFMFRAMYVKAAFPSPTVRNTVHSSMMYRESDDELRLQAVRVIVWYAAALVVWIAVTAIWSALSPDNTVANTAMNIALPVAISYTVVLLINFMFVIRRAKKTQVVIS